MKTIKTTISVLLVTLLFSFTAIAQDNPLAGVSIEYPNYAKNVAIAKEYVAALNEGNAKKASDLLHDKAIIKGLGGGNESLSKQDHFKYYNQSLTASFLKTTNEVYLPLKTENNEQVGNYEWVFIWGNVNSTIKKTKKYAETPFHVVATIAEGKITSLDFYYDNMAFLEINGYTLAPIKE